MEIHHAPLRTHSATGRRLLSQQPPSSQRPRCMTNKTEPVEHADSLKKFASGRGEGFPAPLLGHPLWQAGTTCLGPSSPVLCPGS